MTTKETKTTKKRGSAKAAGTIVAGYPLTITDETPAAYEIRTGLKYPTPIKDAIDAAGVAMAADIRKRIDAIDDDAESGVNGPIDAGFRSMAEVAANAFEQMERAGVDFDSDPLTFSGPAGGDRLPELERFAGGDNMIGPLADVFHASGYFGDLTPAQIAVHIIAGRSLGLDDAQSVFDLEVGPGPTVRYKPARPYEKAADDIAATIAAFDRTTPEKASASGTPEPALTAAGSIHYPEFGDAFICGIKEIDGDDFTRPGEVAQISDHLANKGPLLDQESESGQPGPEGSADASGLNDASAIYTKNETSTPAADPLPASIGATGNETGEVVQAWRNSLESICRELSLNAVEKLANFDKGSLGEKRKMFESSTEYYSGKIEACRAFVLETLAGDGKHTLDQQKGFFIYAEVPLNPDDWTFAHARKAEIEVLKFCDTKPAA